jgi:hypothetical protein
MLNNAKIQNPNEQNTKTWNNVLARSLFFLSLPIASLLVIARSRRRRSNLAGFEFSTFEL